MADRSDKVLDRAKKRFKECVEWEAQFRMRFKDDLQFLYADSDNQAQWPASVRAQRAVAGQIMVTVNKTHTHWLHVVNQARENRPSISISPTGDNSTYESAQIFEQVIKRIEYISDAETAYDVAVQNQVGGGVGYWRILTKYSDSESFDQDAFICEINDPLSVYLDPFIKKQDGSDARFGFIFSEMPRAEAEKKYPGALKKAPALGDMAENWMRADSVRIAEYYEKSEEKEWLYAVPGDDGSVEMVKESDLPPEGVQLIRKSYEERDDIRRRRVSSGKVNWYLIVGDEIVDRAIWPGKYIPIVRVIGEETVLENRLDRKGIVRYLKDGQRMYNYNAAAALEYGALQSKTPYIAPVQAIEGLENYWATANNQNHAFLPYNHITELGGDPIPPPSRQQPPSSAPAYLEGMQTAEHEMMMASGQYDATFSNQGNEISGVSIEQRVKQGERATFHYQDNLSKSIRFTGKILIDLIPKIYDTKRLLRIMDESGEEHAIQIDPSQKGPVKRDDDESESKISAIFNPSVGEYEVMASVGPNFETRRKDAFNAMTTILANNPQMANVIGDLYMANADFPAADKLQERMRNWIKSTSPAILEEGPSPLEQQQHMQLQQAAQMIQNLQQQIKDKSVEQAFEKQRIDMEALEHLAVRLDKERGELIEAFKAETDRLKAVAPVMSNDALDPIVRKVIEEITRAPDPDLGRGGPIDGAAVYASSIDNVIQQPQTQGQSAPSQQSSGA